LARLAQLENDHREHVRMCQKEFKAGTDKFNQIMGGIEGLGDKVESCVQEVCELKTNTADMVKFSNDVKSTGRLMDLMQKFVLGCIKWLGLPAVIYGAVKWLFTQGPPSL
jgi:hypothetical protein